MILPLVFRGLRRGRARFACAVAGIAVATGALVFMTSLVSTNAAQAGALAKRAVAPWGSWTLDAKGTADLRIESIAMTIDYRPGGHVLQGPPMRSVIGAAPSESPYDSVRLIEGRWVNDTGAEPEVVATRNVFRRFGRGEGAKIGETLRFVGREGTMTARLVGYLEERRLPQGFPTVFANGAAFTLLANERHNSISLWRDSSIGELGPESEEVKRTFAGDEQRRMDYAKPLMLVAAFLTALSLLVNSLLLSVESNRRTLATLRTIGLTRSGVVAFVTCESLFAGAVGWLTGTLLSMAALTAYVASDAAAFPTGVAFDWSKMALTLAVLPLVVFMAVLFALRPALSVRPMDADASRPRPRRFGMAGAFAFGFASFVAVEVWGASLMRAFIPSPEWPDAIVSLLPSGVSAFDIEKLRDVEGVRRISELLPLQVEFEEKGGRRRDEDRGMRGENGANALFLAAEWLPEFRFIEGDWKNATRSLADGGVVITEMMSRARGLHLGDMIFGDLPIVGVVDLNWHMVTSRGLVRGLNRAPVMTDGPVFASFDTVESLDRRPAAMVKMTHLWVEYEPVFLAKHGVFGAGRLIEEDIRHRLGDPDEVTVRLHARDEIADGTLAHGSDVIGQAARVPFIFLAILAIGFIAMLVAEADARRKTLTILRAVGATRAQLAARLAMSAVRTALWGMSIGLPVGALAGWLFTFGTGNWPGLPHWFVLPVGVVAEGALGALVFALAFAVPTALSLVRPRRDRGSRFASE